MVTVIVVVVVAVTDVTVVGVDVLYTNCSASRSFFLCKWTYVDEVLVTWIVDVVIRPDVMTIVDVTVLVLVISMQAHTDDTKLASLL